MTEPRTPALPHSRTPLVAVVDYGAGNLHSVRRALEKVGARPEITGDPERLRTADGIVLPGQGNAKAAMEQLDRLGLSAAMRERAEAGTPLLGVCLGMQLFFGANEEGPSRGLDLLPGRVVRMGGGRKVPHMGWNLLEPRHPSPLFPGDEREAYAYFAHSYRALPDEPSDVVAVCEYGDEVVSIAGRGNVVGTQFHPEKSGAAGLRMYERFVAMVTGALAGERR